MTEELYRRYEQNELQTDGYPVPWREIKTAVRDAAGNRCVRCNHPYRIGEHGTGEWSPCDETCVHRGPIRYRDSALDGNWRWRKIDLDAIGMTAGEAHFDADGFGDRSLRWQVEAQWRILTVHHLDGDKTNNEWWNLASLCQRCHLTIQGRVVMAQVWPWEHSSWFREYVAGYYAWSYLQERLTREEVIARLDELLALERAAA